MRLKGYDYKDAGYYFITDPQSVSAIVRGYKSAVTRRCHEAGITDFSWKRGYCDRFKLFQTLPSEGYVAGEGWGRLAYVNMTKFNKK